MKILYGIQGTGNGHISRARALKPALTAGGAEVDCLFSGRAADKFFDMDVFGDYQIKQGITFITSNLKIKYWQTIRNAGLKQFFKDVKAIDLSRYDLVITDFEPITAWAAKKQNKDIVGIGHQYSYVNSLPPKIGSLPTKLATRFYAPTKESLGLNWHHYDQPILPPIVGIEEEMALENQDFTLVYLPFNNGQEAVKTLQKIKDKNFRMHSADVKPGDYGNVTVFPFDRKLFMENLHHCNSVLCNAGFELVSESLQLGKKIMVLPLKGQDEQRANAATLADLSLASVQKTLVPEAIKKWQEEAVATRVEYPDVSSAIAQWILDGRQQSPLSLAENLWAQVQVTQQ